MTPAIKEVLLAISGSLPASVVVKVTAVTALALFAVWLARGSRAAVRHALLAAAFGVMLLLPLASAIVPVHLEVPMVVENRTSASTPLLRGDGEVAPILITHDPDVRVLSAPYSRGISLSKLLLTGWIAGVAIFLLPLLIGLWQIRLFRRSGLPWPHGQSLAGEIARDAGIYRRVEVVLHEGVPGPMTCGILRPGIVLPQDAETWNEEDLSRAFVHELEHVRRGDWVSSCLARAVCAVYWFHPLVWIAWRRLALEAERSCDDAVLRRSDATAYAEQLVGLAKRLYAAQRSPVVAMANRADLTTRVRAVLDMRQQRRRAGAFSLTLAAASAMVLVISMSSLVLVAAPQAAPARTTPQASDAAPAEPDTPRVVAQVRTLPPPAPAAEAKLEFEVASVRRVEIPTVNGGVPVFPTTGGVGTSNPHRITYRGTWLAPLIADAFGVRPDQITGLGPVSNERYDIVANIPEGATKEQFNVMLGNLLQDRFHLRFHMASKVRPVYALRVAKNGPKFRETARRVDDAAVPAGGIGAPDAEGCPILPPNYQGMVGWPAAGQVCWAGQDVPVAEVARLVERPAGRPVIDETGLTGSYDFKIRFESIRRPTDAAGVASDPAPSVFNAVDQLGLKLESATHTFPQLIIDSIDLEPAEN